MQDFNFYKVNETLNHRYYQIPQELFVNPLYKNTLNSDSKLLYGFLLNRLSLSIKNNWHDEDGNVYLIFTRKEVQENLNLKMILILIQKNKLNMKKNWSLKMKCKRIESATIYSFTSFIYYLSHFQDVIIFLQMILL